MTLHPAEDVPRLERRGPALVADARSLGLRRHTVATVSGRVVVHSSPATSGVATVLIHGAAGSWTTWTPLLTAAARSGAPMTNVVAIDIPGWGESRTSARPLDVAQLSRAVCEIAQSLGYTRWTVIGHSLGGLVALDIAARTPARTDAVLVVSASGPAVLDAIRRPIRAGAALPWFLGMLLTMRVLAALGSFGTRVVRALHDAGLLRMLSAPLFSAPSRVHHTVVDALADEIRPRAFVAAARAAASYDMSLWRRIACPVRSLSGARDVFVADDDAAALDGLIDDFAHETVTGAGHFAAIERPDAVLRILRDLDARSVARSVRAAVA